MKKVFLFAQLFIVINTFGMADGTHFLNFNVSSIYKKKLSLNSSSSLTHNQKSKYDYVGVVVYNDGDGVTRRGIIFKIKLKSNKIITYNGLNNIRGEKIYDKNGQLISEFIDEVKVGSKVGVKGKDCMINKLEITIL